MTGAVRIGIVGAAGRMGRALVRVLADGPGRLAGALERPEHVLVGSDAGRVAGREEAGIPITDAEDRFFAGIDVAIAFAAPEAVARHAVAAARAHTGLVIGTTGLGCAEREALREAGETVPVVWSANMSLGINLLAHLVRMAAAALGPDWDVEILEMHHAAKRDAPSGTALALGRAAAAGRGIDPEASAVRGRDGDTGPRTPGTIGYGVLRGGDVVGDHVVVLAGAGERLELGHRAHDRSIFARGAVRAATWAVRQRPGLYGMGDVLGLPG